MHAEDEKDVTSLTSKMAKRGEIQKREKNNWVDLKGRGHPSKGCRRCPLKLTSLHDMSRILVTIFYFLNGTVPEVRRGDRHCQPKNNTNELFKPDQNKFDYDFFLVRAPAIL